MDMEFKVSIYENLISALLFMYLHLTLKNVYPRPAGAVCYPGDRFTDCLHDVGHHCSGQRSWHRVGQRREEE